MSESAAPSGSSRCASEVDVFSDKPHVEQQDYTLAAQQQLKQTAIKEQSDAKPPPQDEWLRGLGWVMTNGIKEAPRVLLSNGGANLSEDSLRRLKLYRAALNGDWAVAKDIYDKYKVEIGQEITNLGNTALHVAAQANCIDFVKELLKMMSTEDLAKKNKIGCTAFFYAAASGMVEIVEEMMKGNKDIAMVPDMDGTLPIVRAAALEQGQMVLLLHKQTKNSLTDDDCIELLVQLIETGFYVVALQLLRDRPRLATKRAENEETALHVLARKDLTSTNQNRRGTFFQRCFNLVSGAEKEENKQALELVESLWTEVVLSSESVSEISKLIARPTRLIFDAAKRGNVLFLLILIREYADLMRKCDENGYTIFHVAVLNRLEELFKFIYDAKSIADLMVDSNDGEGEMFDPPLYMDIDNASSYMIVATLIVALVFGAAITVPGGNKEDVGLPFLRHKTSFKVFAVSNVISLVASSVSIVNFLSILAPRYAEEDFLYLLSRKLLFGLATLFIAIAAMMVVFSATRFIVFRDGSIWIANLAIVVSSMPVILFIKQHSNSFMMFDGQPMKGKTGLFHKAGKTKTTKHQWKSKLFNGSNLTIPCTSSCCTNV
ncbi:ANK REP REGION domain-containing protein [Citrus sinensis]|uniref:ANK REP REGION domain-containing protein n=1 Tax=Citrus sinensis TaxID=2711 RepID=A0ACB8HV09_CITSI|nr:ANK REP REGION domain-containing protein [Citrus sinensis]